MRGIKPFRIIKGALGLRRARHKPPEIPQERTKRSKKPEGRRAFYRNRTGYSLYLIARNESHGSCFLSGRVIHPQNRWGRNISHIRLTVVVVIKTPAVGIPSRAAKGLCIPPHNVTHARLLGIHRTRNRKFGCHLHKHRIGPHIPCVVRHRKHRVVLADFSIRMRNL